MFRIISLKGYTRSITKTLKLAKSLLVGNHGLHVLVLALEEAGELLHEQLLYVFDIGFQAVGLLWFGGVKRDKGLSLEAEGLIYGSILKHTVNRLSYFLCITESTRTLIAQVCQTTNNLDNTVLQEATSLVAHKIHKCSNNILPIPRGCRAVLDSLPLASQNLEEDAWLNVI